MHLVFNRADFLSVQIYDDWCRQQREWIIDGLIEDGLIEDGQPIDEQMIEDGLADIIDAIGKDTLYKMIQDKAKEKQEILNKSAIWEMKAREALRKCLLRGT